MDHPAQEWRNTHPEIRKNHAHANRLGITLPTCPWDDTLDLARRFLDLERHDLATVCRHLGTQSFPSLRALADAAATAEVLLRLAPPLADGARARKKLISRHGKHFLPIAHKLASWIELSRLASNPTSL